jgi:ferric-dicitrate binding protein FerR (iron transport regulator)
MTDKDLIDLFFTGELTDGERAQLDREIEMNPELLHEIVAQQEMEQALRVVLGDGTADQEVTVSVLSDLRGAPIDDFKKNLMAEVQAAEARKQKEEASLRVLPQVEAAPPKFEEKPPSRPIPVAKPPHGRPGWVWGLPIGAAAAAAALLAVLLHRGETGEAKSRAYLLSATPDVRVQRGNSSFAAKVDMALEPGDRITTGEGGQAKIGFADDPTRVEIRSQAEIRLARGGRRLELEKGEIEASVPSRGGEPLEVTSLQAELRVREAEVRLLGAADFTRLEVRRGSALFTRRSDGRRIEVAALQFAVAGKDVEFLARALGPAPSGFASPAAVAVVRRVQGDVFVYNQSPAERLPLRAGQPVLEHQGLVTEGAKSQVVLDYSDTTRLEIGGDSVIRRLTDEKDRTRKHVTLEAGSLFADVTKQPAGRPMILSTVHADARVLGTRFSLSAESGQTRLQVEEGAVQFTQSRERESIVVRSGFSAVAAPGRPFEAVPVPGAPKFLEIDLSAGASEGEGEWRSEGRAVRQTRVSRQADGALGSPVSSLMYGVEDKELGKGGVLLEATAEVNQVTPDVLPGVGAWGFGLAADFRSQNVILQSHQGAEGGSVFGFKDVGAIPFEHGREGTYRLKLRIERRTEQAAILRGKIWQGDREPDGWMIESELALDGPLVRVGFRTMRCSCTFTSFRVKVLGAKEESH